MATRKNLDRPSISQVSERPRHPRPHHPLVGTPVRLPLSRSKPRAGTAGTRPTRSTACVPCATRSPGVTRRGRRWELVQSGAAATLPSERVPRPVRPNSGQGLDVAGRPSIARSGPPVGRRRASHRRGGDAAGCGSSAISGIAACVTSRRNMQATRASCASRALDLSAATPPPFRLATARSWRPEHQPSSTRSASKPSRSCSGRRGWPIQHARSASLPTDALMAALIVLPSRRRDRHRPAQRRAASRRLRAFRAAGSDTGSRRLFYDGQRVLDAPVPAYGAPGHVSRNRPLWPRPSSSSSVIR